MTDQPLRVLFCVGMNQNFFDLPSEGVNGADVWKATVSLTDQLKALPGVDFIADFDDDAHLVGPSTSWPWTWYVLADVDSQETVKAACNLFRTVEVGNSEYKFWRYAKVEARMGRPLTVRPDVNLEEAAQ